MKVIFAAAIARTLTDTSSCRCTADSTAHTMSVSLIAHYHADHCACPLKQLRTNCGHVDSCAKASWERLPERRIYLMSALQIYWQSYRVTIAPQNQRRWAHPAEAAEEHGDAQHVQQHQLGHGAVPQAQQQPELHRQRQ